MVNADPVQVARRLRVSTKSVYQRRRWRAGQPHRGTVGRLAAIVRNRLKSIRTGPPSSTGSSPRPDSSPGQNRPGSQPRSGPPDHGPGRRPAAGPVAGARAVRMVGAAGWAWGCRVRPWVLELPVDRGLYRIDLRARTYQYVARNPAWQELPAGQNARNKRQFHGLRRVYLRRRLSGLPANRQAPQVRARSASCEIIATQHGQPGG